MFDFILNYFHKPLQIMISSKENEIINFIEYAGFKLKRILIQENLVKYIMLKEFNQTLNSHLLRSLMKYLFKFVN